MPHGIRIVAVAALTLLSAACVGPPTPPIPPAEKAPRLVLSPVSFDALPGWRDDDPEDALQALRRSCAILMREEADKPVGPNAIGGTVADWRRPCAAAAEADAPGQAFFEAWFRPFAVAAPDGADGLFTGYYEPEIDGSLSRRSGFGTPLFARPPDLVTVDLGDFRADLKGESLAGRVVDGRLRPYLTRAEIDGGAFAGDAVAWVADPVDAFFLHIQGSGVIRLFDGGRVRVGYAANNGHGFVGIGKILIEEGKLGPDALSMQAVRAWLRDHPDEAPALMRRNPRYIFFRRVEGDGPIGAQGAVLAAGRSLAVDAALLPLGAPIWLDTTWPDGTAQAGEALRRLMIAQDTGGAIKGAVRGDVFWGSGEAALAVAGRMKQRGRYFILLPRGLAIADVVAAGS